MDQKLTDKKEGNSAKKEARAAKKPQADPKPKPEAKQYRPKTAPDQADIQQSQLVDAPSAEKSRRQPKHENVETQDVQKESFENLKQTLLAQLMQKEAECAQLKQALKTVEEDSRQKQSQIDG